MKQLLQENHVDMELNLKYNTQAGYIPLATNTLKTKHNAILHQLNIINNVFCQKICSETCIPCLVFALGFFFAPEEERMDDQPSSCLGFRFCDLLCLF